MFQIVKKSGARLSQGKGTWRSTTAPTTVKWRISLTTTALVWRQPDTGGCIHILGTSHAVLGLSSGNRCPECSEHIVCLSHYIWHWEHGHKRDMKTCISEAPHLRCLACSACIPMESAWTHKDIFCPFTVVAALQQGPFWS